MKAVITPFVQKELGVATFKVDQEVRKLVEAGRKFIMEPVPRELIEHMDDGLVVSGNDSNLLIVFYVQIMPDDFVMQLHRF